jgi:RimJ/RimL family protein N-acetyltransferase
MYLSLLNHNHCNQLLQHLLRLSPEDRRLRFCLPATDEYIRKYVFEMIRSSDFCFGAFSEDGVMIAMAHVAVIDGPKCELAFTINEEHRGTGLARQLMRIAVEHCDRIGATKLCMSCLKDNKKMQSLAKSFGLHLMLDGPEVYAERRREETDVKST